MTAHVDQAHPIRLANARAEVLVSKEFGPRIVGYALAGGENIFGEIPPGEQGKPTPYRDDWHIYGGHRLWHAPEDPVRTYWPDNKPVRAEAEGRTLTVTQAVEGNTQLEKQMAITLAPDSAHVTVVHRIANRGVFEVELAVWALTVMAKGGRAIFPNAPFVPFPEGLSPAGPLVLWPYTRLRDPRWTFGDRFLVLRQDERRAEPQKIGFYNGQGWMAYERGGLVFVKTFQPLRGPHADFGCNTETFTNAEFLELETLSPLARIAPGGIVEHTERWCLFEAELPDDEARLEEALAPLVANAGGAPDARMPPRTSPL